MQVDLGQKVGTAIASLGSFVTTYVASEQLINELIRLLSSSIIAALGALIGFFVTKALRKWEKRIEERNKIKPPCKDL